MNGTGAFPWEGTLSPFEGGVVKVFSLCLEALLRINNGVATGTLNVTMGAILWTPLGCAVVYSDEGALLARHQARVGVIYC